MNPLLTTLLAVHLLAFAAWVGGVFYALVVLRPALDGLDPAPRLALHVRTLKRFFLVVWHAMPLTIITGFWMMFAVWGGFRGVPWPIHAMLASGLLMAAVFLYAYFAPFRRLRRAIRPAPEILGRIRTLVAANLALGVLTAVFGALGHGW